MHYRHYYPQPSARARAHWYHVHKPHTLYSKFQNPYSAPQSLMPSHMLCRGLGSASLSLNQWLESKINLTDESSLHVHHDGFPKTFSHILSLEAYRSTISGTTVRNPSSPCSTSPKKLIKEDEERGGIDVRSGGGPTITSSNSSTLPVDSTKSSPFASMDLTPDNDGPGVSTDRLSLLASVSGVEGISAPAQSSAEVPKG